MISRVYKYGAVPLKKFPEVKFPREQFPEEGVEELRRANKLRNSLVWLHRKNNEKFEAARVAADAEYGEIAEKLDALEKTISQALTAKRQARAKAGTRDAKHPLVKAASETINELTKQRSDLWKALKPARIRADKRVDRKALTKQFDDAVKVVQHVKETGGLSSHCANEIVRYFKESRSRALNERATLRYRRFDGTGFWFYRFREPGVNKNGVDFDGLLTGNKTEARDNRNFVLTEKSRRGKRVIYKLRAKIAGGAKKDSKVYGHFDLILHRPIPENARIQSAKILRHRTGDKFTYTVSFTLKLPDVEQQTVEGSVLGLDIGFREMERNNSYRIATLATNDQSRRVETIDIARENRRGFLARMNHIDDLRSTMDENATELGKKLLPLLKTAKPLPDSHQQFIFTERLRKTRANVTLDFERSYKMARWFIRAPDEADFYGPEIVGMVLRWWEENSFKYREMHNLRRKALAERKEVYRMEAARLVGFGIPIAVEKLDMSKWAERKDSDNELSNRALSSRFLVAPSELIAAIENAAKREGVPFIKVNAANTSKACHACGTINKALKGELIWTCEECETKHDRDINAAINIAKRGILQAKKEKKQ